MAALCTASRERKGVKEHAQVQRLEATSTYFTNKRMTVCALCTAQAAAEAAMMNATLTAALDSVQLSAEERAARLHRLHFVAAASFKALNESGGALVTAMLQAWPSYWNAVQAVAAAGALPI